MLRNKDEGPLGPSFDSKVNTFNDDFDIDEAREKVEASRSNVEKLIDDIKDNGNKLQWDEGTDKYGISFLKLVTDNLTDIVNLKDDPINKEIVKGLTTKLLLEAIIATGVDRETISADTELPWLELTLGDIMQAFVTDNTGFIRAVSRAVIANNYIRIDCSSLTRVTGLYRTEEKVKEYDEDKEGITFDEVLGGIVAVASIGLLAFKIYEKFNADDVIIIDD